MKKVFNKFKIIIIAAVLYLVVFILKRNIFFNALNITKNFLIEMVEILPPVLVITALISVWIPSNVIKKGLGHNSGIRGKLISLLIGSLSAGPIYAAFPATLILFKKGASISNMVIILSSWAVVKIPMLIVETNFLGPKFTVTRVVLTVPAILLMGVLMEKIIKNKDINSNDSKEYVDYKNILSSLPNINCGACGYTNCTQFAIAVFNNNKKINDCIRM